MEGVGIYEESYKELTKLRKSLSSSSVISIDLSKLDTNSKGKILEALNKAVSERLPKVSSVMCNNN